MRLLIIDDEPIIVNGLKAFFEKREMSEVEVVTAYSAAEAISKLDSSKIDVVLSDINMPAMSGIELLAYIEKRWPKCKVIFLTGYSEFDYVHQAMRSPIVTDYILKTEEMELIGQAVDRAIQAIKDELSVYNQKEWLQQQLPKVIHQLQRQLVIDLLHRMEADLFQNLQNELDALKLPFIADQPVMAIMLTVEDWGKYEQSFERDLMLYAVCNIAEELLGERTKTKFVQLDRSTVIGLIQSPQHLYTSQEKQADLTAQFTYGTTESIQQACGELFQLSVSAAVSEKLLPFPQLVQEIHRMRLEMLNSGIKGANKLSIVKPSTEADSVDQQELSQRVSSTYTLEQLQQSMIDGTGAEWSGHYERFIATFPTEGPVDPINRMLVIQELSKVGITILEELGLKDQAISGIHLAQILQFTSMTPWHQVTAYYQSLFEWVQATRNDQLSAEESQLIGRIHYYVHNNLDGDVSLTQIAREVSLNPSYLSRWYKLKAGKGLSDYIQEVKIDKAKEMLDTTSYKVHEISEKLGFTDPHYFFRFFKKIVGCTPQEYRTRKAYS